jgi:hypothetical protein
VFYKKFDNAWVAHLPALLRKALQAGLVEHIPVFC